MTVARILEKKGRSVKTIQPHIPLSHVAQALSAKRIGALVVVDVSGTMKGIVSERDVVGAIAAWGIDAIDEPVSRFMTEEVVTATEELSVVEVARMMTDGRFRHLPVLDGDRRLVGLISIGDAMKYRLEQLETEQSAFREYIAA